MTKEEQIRKYAYSKAIFEASNGNPPIKGEEEPITKEEFLKSIKNTISFTMMSVDDIRDDLDSMELHLEDLNHILSSFIDNIDEYKELIKKEKE
jgi:hypothetical protein